MRFLEEEFQQHFLEHESRPDISVIVWTETPNGIMVLDEQDFEEEIFEDGFAANLGIITLECKASKPEGKLDAPHIKGSRARGLTLDDRLLGYALEHVLPIVEKHTGWEGLQKHVDIEFVEDFVQTTKIFDAYLQDRLNEIEGPGIKEYIKDQIEGIFQNRLFGGMYEPLSKQILLNANIGGLLSLESFIVLLGHELVHMGQFANHPELLEYQRSCSIWENIHIPQFGETFGYDSVEFLATMPQQTLMSDLEGQAQYVEQDFLSEAYNGSTPNTLSLFDRGVSMFIKSIAENVLGLKQRQYTLGRRYVLHEALRLEDKVATFDQTSVFLREVKYHKTWRKSMAQAINGDWQSALKTHAKYVKGIDHAFDPTHPRRFDARYQHSVLMALNTSRMIDVHAYQTKTIKEVTEYYGIFHPLSLRERYRSLETLQNGEALFLGWPYIEPMLENAMALQQMFDECSEWFEPSFASSVADHIRQTIQRLRKRITEEIKTLLEQYGS